MKLFLKSCSIFVFIMSSYYLTASVEDNVKKAADCYAKGNYEQSISLYKQLIDQGYESAGLYYNLGNSYFKLDQIGKAIYNYEKARKINPTDDNILHNLDFANERIIDKIDSKENYLLNSIQSSLYSISSTEQWAYISIFGSLLFASLLALYFLVVKTHLKKLFFYSSVLVLIAVVLVFFLGKSEQNNLRKKSSGIILSAVVQIKNEPTEKGKAIFSLHEGTKVRILEESGEWVNIRIQNGNEGWIRNNEVGLF